MPGAGSLKALNYIVNVSPKDGTVIGAVQRDAPMVELLGKPGPQFKTAELAWIGNLTLLEPYRPLFIATVLLLFGWAGWQVHRPIEACEPGTACAVPQTRKRA